MQQIAFHRRFLTVDLSEVGSSTADTRHPWELSRSANLLRLSKTYLSGATVADIGAGDGYFSSLVANCGAKTVLAVDNAYQSAETTQDQVTRIADISKLNQKEIDVVFLMDVLEHVDDDIAFLKESIASLRQGGAVFITVPALDFLYSQHDLALKHYRRYSMSQVIKLAKAVGLSVESSFYFYSTLVPIRLLKKFFSKKVPRYTGEKSTHELNSDLGNWRLSTNSLATIVLVGILNLDFRICQFLSRFNIHLPGLSVVCVCKKI